MNNLFDVGGKVILITGGNRGIGHVLACGLQKAGANVVITSRKDSVMNIPIIFVDLFNREERASVISQVIAMFGKVDVLINNAGVIDYGYATDFPVEKWDSNIELMLTAVLDLSSQAGRVMEEQKSGKIINIASVSSFIGAKSIIGYVTAKHGLIGLTKSMAIALAPHGINVNAIAPGYMDTDMYADLVTRVGSENKLLERVPAGRVGHPIDLLGATIFLSSKASDYVYGHTLVVDGGMISK
jgi:2-deoxy-D-gluconate 3-dehydrogenase